MNRGDVDALAAFTAWLANEPGPLDAWVIQQRLVDVIRRRYRRYDYERWMWDVLVRIREERKRRTAAV